MSVQENQATKAFWTDPRWGCVTWPLFVGIEIYRSGPLWMIIAGAVFTGISYERWLGK